MEAKKENAFAYFYLLKFIGSFLIAIFLHYNDHFLTYLYTPNPFHPRSLWYFLSHESHIFVEMYFLISGILFTYAYKGKIQNGLSLSSFLLGRIKRIYPWAIVTTLYMYFANYLLFQKTGEVWSCGTLSRKDLLFDLLLAGKCIFHGNKTLNAPIWYISILMLVYLLSFLLTSIGKKITKNSKLEHLFYLVPILLGIGMRFSKTQAPFWNEDIARGLIAYFSGILLGEFLKWNDLSQKRIQKLSFRISLGFLFVLSVIILQRFMLKLGDPYLTSFSALVVFPLLLLLCYDVRWLNRLCETNPMKWLGMISFGIYLWNFPIYITLHFLIQCNYLKITINSPYFLILVGLLHLLIASLAQLITILINRTFKTYKASHE